MSKSYDLVLFGATGFTGQLVAAYLNKQYGSSGALKWAIAARNPQKLKSIAESLDAAIPTITADSHDLESLEMLAAQARVVCSTVGPYALHGSLLVEACIKQGTHYCDITGEVPWIKRMIDQHHQDAVNAQVKIVHCCGFDSIPSDLGVYFLQQHSLERFGKHCESIKLAVKAARGGLSGGTYASLTNVLEEARMDPSVREILTNPYGLNPAEYQSGPDQFELHGITFDKDFNSWAAPFIMAAINTRVVQRSHALAEFPYGPEFQYSEMTLTGGGFMGKLRARILNKVIQQMTSEGGVLKSIANYFMPNPGQGPSASQREKGYFNMSLIGKLGDDQMIRAKVTGDADPGYGSTSKMLAESAICLSQDDTNERYGVLTPSAAMGQPLLERLQKNAGLKFTLMD